MNAIIQTTQCIIGDSILEISYIIASLCFVFGLKMLSHPDTARKGNIIAAFGMGLAIVTTITLHTIDGVHIGNIPLILLAIAIGTVIGWMVALKVKMTAMPQLVSLFNGMGGGAAALIALMEFPHIETGSMANGHVLAILLGIFIGSVSFAGSMIAFGKLDGRIGDIRAPWLRYLNMALLVVLLGIIVFIMATGTSAESVQS